MRAQHPSRLVLDRPAGSDQIGRVLREEGAVVGAGDEAHLLRVRLARNGQAHPSRVLACLGLRLAADREHRASELLLPEHVQYVGLVLGHVGAAAEVPPAPNVPPRPHVVAGRHDVEACLVGALEERAELDPLVAPHAGVGRAARAMLVEEVGEHRPGEPLAHVDDLEFESHQLGDGPSVGLGLWSAAPVVDAVEVHELQVGPEDAIALLM